LRQAIARARRSSLGVFVFAAKGGTGGPPPREALVSGLVMAGAGEDGFEFEQGTRQGIVVGFEQPEPFGQLADFGAALGEQFGVFKFEALLFRLKCLQLRSDIGHDRAVSSPPGD
jgi:hypothetical protein